MKLHLGVFDSGIGGLTVVQAIQQHLPFLQITYFGDTAFTPYGEKGSSWISQRSFSIANFLQKRGANILFVACGTASVCALQDLKDSFSNPVFGVIDPLVEATNGTRIAILATTTTVRLGGLAAAIQKKIPHAIIDSFACPKFVPLLESWCTDRKSLEDVVEETLHPINLHCYDTVVLGCTHYPLLANIIKEKIQKNIFLVNIADAAALNWSTFLQRNFLSSPYLKNPHPNAPLLQPTIYVSCDPLGFREKLKKHFPAYISAPIVLEPLHSETSQIF